MTVPGDINKFERGSGEQVCGVIVDVAGFAATTG